MADITSDRPGDPDAQAAVTDFLDYTEYLPSDLLRSLTLIRGLDDKYTINAYAIHDLTKVYGSIPSLEPTMRPDAQGLRLDISSRLDQALNARESAYAEASRLFDVADRHQNRLKSIIAKLRAIPKPPLRDPSEDTPASAQKRSRAGRKLENGMSATRLTLNPPRGNTVAAAILRRPRGRRVTVPGEVMPPYDPDEAIESTEVSDWESPPPPSPPRPVPVLKLKQPKPPKERLDTPVDKPPRVPREHVSYRKPTPPPEDAEVGSKHLPWTHLTEYEMYRLRKKMKKNHEWEPSQVMIRRELELRGRGWDNYYKAKAEAEKSGKTFVDFDSSSQAKTERPEPTPTLAATPSVVEMPVAKSKASKKKGESKKNRKPDPARDRAALAAQEAEIAARRLGDLGSTFKNLFSPLSNVLASLNRSTSTPTANASAAGKKNAKKRKLDQLGVSASPSAEPEAQRKKQKLIAAKPVSISATASEPPPPARAASKGPSLKLTVKPPVIDSTESSTPASGTRAASAARSSVAPKTEDSTPPPPTRSVSQKSTSTPEESRVPTPLPEATPVVATRSSTRVTPAATARQTPVVETSPKIAIPTAASRRPKREVPGTMMQSSQDGGAAVTVSQRKTKPIKTPKPPKAPRASASSPEIRVDVDGTAEVVDPDEERYCICGDVSYGEMICCEMDEKVSSCFLDESWFMLTKIAV